MVAAQAVQAMQYSQIVEHIFTADNKGEGIHLSWQEVFWLSEVLQHAEAQGHAEILDEERKEE